MDGEDGVRGRRPPARGVAGDFHYVDSNNPPGDRQSGLPAGHRAGPAGRQFEEAGRVVVVVLEVGLLVDVVDGAATDPALSCCWAWLIRFWASFTSVW